MLFLENFRAKGFKSYAEEVDVTFNPGIGVIIGNNGVGKSNILDGITWVLGEDDPKKLRCYQTEDLLYSGSKNLAPAQKAWVELRFKEGPGKDAPAFAVSRTLERSGAETYQVGDERLDGNRYRGRLYELGLGDALKTLVRQEQINDFLDMHPADRLSYFLQFTGLSTDGSSEKVRIDRFNKEFRHLFKQLMYRGDAKLFLESYNGRPGLEIEILFPDKGAKVARFISGGEKTVTSLAAKLALFGQLQSPFYLLDEVEPSLDWTNHRSMSNLFKELAKERQLIIITHLRSTIQVANTVHGVRTNFDGSSWMKFHFVMDKRLLRLYKCC